MIQYKAGGSFRATFTTTGTSGGSAALDSVDAARVVRNGTTDSAVTPVVTAIQTGLYSLTFTIPVGYASGDLVEVLLQGTQDAIQEWFTVSSFMVQDATIDAIPTAAEVFAAVLTTAITESYAADGTAPTLAQAIFLIQQKLGETAIVGTTQTVKKLDGTTTAATFTLDSATDPTSITRAS